MTAAGSISIAICQRCQRKKAYTALRPDSNQPGLRVCAECWDLKDPYRLPARQTEDISLRFPRPDVPISPNANYLGDSTTDFAITDDYGNPIGP